MLSRLKIGQRLSIAFLLLLSLLVILAGVSAVQMGKLFSTTEHYSANIIPSLTTGRNLSLHLGDFRRYGFMHVLSNSSADMDKQEAAMERTWEDLQKSLSLYEKDLSANSEDLVLIEKAKVASKAYRDEWEKIKPISRLTVSNPEKTQEANQMMLGSAAHAYFEAQKALDNLWAADTKEAQELHTAAVAGYASARWFLGGVVSAAILMGIAAAVVITRSITVPPQTAADFAAGVTAGDLTAHVAAQGHDEISRLLQSLQQMQANLRRVVGEVRSNAESVASASYQIAQGNTDLSQRTEEQASALQQTSATMDELGTTVRHNTENAQQANHLALTASTVATQGGQVVAKVVNTIQGINDSSRKIGEIIGIIDGIAFQTNILALNAAVEAARAGEQGRGFAVVASEVRALAQRSAEAAKEIKHLINSNVEQVQQGSTLATQAGKTMEDIVESIRQVTNMVGEISQASIQQSTGVNQVGLAVNQMDTVTQQNAALVEQSAAAAESLKGQAQQLVRLVSVFKVT